jgi:hypothetical protein
MAHLSAPAFAAAMAITLFAGFVKGAVGFAMPMIMMAAFSSFLPPELALAGLILPTFVTNLSQAFRQGLQPALGTMRRYWRMLVATVVFIVISSAFVYIIPHTLFLLLLGVPIVDAVPGSAPRVSNSALLITGSGPGPRYDKQHLVPFVQIFDIGA